MKYLAAKYPAALKTLVFSVATAIGGVATAQTTVTVLGLLGDARSRYRRDHRHL